MALRSICLILTLLASISSAYAQELQTHDGQRGIWLKNDQVELFVGLEPRFRLLSLRKPGQLSLMLADEKNNEQGMRLAFMGPDQVPASFKVGNEPAALLEQTAASARVRVGAFDQLQYTVSIMLDSARPRVELTYELQNLGAATRTLGCWSVISFPNDGAIVLSAGNRDRARKQMVMQWWSRWPQGEMTRGHDSIRFDAAVPHEKNPLKIGLVTDSGWIAFVKQTQALVSTVTFDPKATYPEQGANITFYQGDDRCETEQMGGLQEVAPSKSVSMTERIDLIELPKPLAEADALRKEIMKQLPK